MIKNSRAKYYEETDFAGVMRNRHGKISQPPPSPQNPPDTEATKPIRTINAENKGSTVPNSLIQDGWMNGLLDDCA